MSDEIPLQSTGDLQSLCRNIYPVLFDTEKTSWTLEELKHAAREDQKSPEGFTSLVHKDVFQYMLANTYDEVAALCPIFDLATLKKLTKEQQSLSVTHPSGNPARWAILSTWIAVALRFRAAGGSEGEYSHVIKSYYCNATLVLSDLILQNTTLQNIQSLLFMAILAEVLGDHRSFVMLVTNAARQMELVARTPPTMLSSEARELYERLLSFSQILDRKVARDHSLVAILAPKDVTT
ncbi:uncharacterized protein E0L32_004635 [Thyridium curvatum]|uniref:Xylanolytic transcriptional activator regulatory domain-containing protein n=1 Tax=Thyridium curvatum TaxID=1093900 RepID=A0A507BF01_9PEZI|nr:uncharacterized protein E0L32_004635 [Thyridium curvatum]TPX15358.1 hypothetical protein E0L32_004635 [Thyridium curvatum]